MPLLRCGEYSYPWMGPRDLRHVFNCTGVRPFDEAWPRKDASCDEHCRCGGRGDASGARRRALTLERCGFCNCCPARSFLRAARACRNDRARTNFRRANGFREAAWSFVRQCRRKIRSSVSQNGGRPGRNDLEHEHQILASRISQPKRDRSSVVVAKTNRSAGGGKIGNDRKSRRGGRYHWERAREMAARDPRDSRPQFAVHHDDCADRWRDHKQTIRAGAFQGPRGVEIFGEREGGTQCETERDLPRGGCEHRSCRSCRRPAPDQTRRLSAWAREEPAERFPGRRKILCVG